MSKKSKKRKKSKIKKKIGRNSFVLDARMRNSAGSMKDRREPRGGSKNEQVEYLKEEDTKSSN